MFPVSVSPVPSPRSVCFLMIRRPPRSTLDRSSAASDVYKRQASGHEWNKKPNRSAIELIAPDQIASGPHVEWASRCLLYTSPSPRDRTRSRMPSSA